MVSDQERRRHPRAKAKWSVTLDTSQGVINTEIQDISLGGAFIRCLDPLPPADTFKMVINVPQTSGRLMVGSQVIWVNSHEPDHSITSRGMGVHFSEISGSDRQFLQRMIMERI